LPRRNSSYGYQELFKSGEDVNAIVQGRAVNRKRGLSFGLNSIKSNITPLLQNNMKALILSICHK
jgi:hypothetical protein